MPNHEPNTVFTISVLKITQSYLTVEVILLNLLSGMIFTYWVIRLFD